jgi:hypothetical protein
MKYEGCDDSLKTEADVLKNALTAGNKLVIFRVLPEDGSDIFSRNDDNHLQHFMASNSIRLRTNLQFLDPHSVELCIKTCKCKM